MKTLFHAIKEAKTWLRQRRVHGLNLAVTLHVIQIFGLNDHVLNSIT